MSGGILMAIAQDFTLAPAHAHLNLLGWVTMALYGLFVTGQVGGVVRPSGEWRSDAPVRL
jgi:hypothetical protein